MENRDNISGRSEDIDHPRLAQNLRVAADAINTLKQDNDRLGVENFVLRQRIDLLRNNSDLKTATVLSSIISWMDEKRNSIREGARAGAPFRPVTPVLTETADRYTPSQYDSGSESQYQSPRYSHPSVRFDASRNTTRSPDSFSYMTYEASQRAVSPEAVLQDYEASQSSAVPKIQYDAASMSYDASQRTGSPKIPSEAAFRNYETSQRTTGPKMPSEAPFAGYANSQRGSLKTTAPGRSNVTSPYDKPQRAVNPPPVSDSYRSTKDASTSHGYASADTTLTEAVMGPPQAASSMEGNTNVQSRGTSPGRSFFSQDVPSTSLRAADSGKDDDIEGVDTGRLGEKLARFSRPIDSVIGCRPEAMKSYQGIMELKPTRRIVGEIAFQLDRRILDYVFSYGDASLGGKPKRKRYYGFTITHIFEKIRSESKDANGQPDPKKEVGMRYRLEYILKNLAPLGYILEVHSQFSQEMVNKYGLLSSPPERKTLDNFGLEDPRVLRMLVSKLMIYDDELKNTLILLDCLCLLAHDDGGPLFKW